MISHVCPYSDQEAVEDPPRFEGWSEDGQFEAVEENRGRPPGGAEQAFSSTTTDIFTAYSYSGGWEKPGLVVFSRCRMPCGMESGIECGTMYGMVCGVVSVCLRSHT